MCTSSDRGLTSVYIVGQGPDWCVLCRTGVWPEEVALPDPAALKENLLPVTSLSTHCPQPGAVYQHRTSVITANSNVVTDMQGKSRTQDICHHRQQQRRHRHVEYVTYKSISNVVNDMQGRSRSPPTTTA